NPLGMKPGSVVDDGKQTGLMVDLAQHIAMEGPVSPFVFLGLGAVHESLGSVNGNHFAAEGGLGLLAALGSRLRLRLGVSAMDLNNRDLPHKRPYLVYRFNLDLAMPLGNRPTHV